MEVQEDSCMNKKRSASNEASPRSYVTRASKKRCLVNELFTSVRNNVALATLIYSFLPINDRVRLGEVDQHFYGDKDRGQVVGVYGDNCLDIQEALDKVCEYVQDESNLASVKGWGNTPFCWCWVHEVGTGETSWVAERLERSWFDEKLGYDLKAVKHVDFEEDQEIILQGLASVNANHLNNQKILERLSADIKNLGPYLPSAVS
jgi:hypothetical protein